MWRFFIDGVKEDHRLSTLRNKARVNIFPNITEENRRHLAEFRTEVNNLHRKKEWKTQQEKSRKILITRR